MTRAKRKEQPSLFGSVGVAPVLPANATPDARRLARAEQALKRIESLSMDWIHEYGVTQETPEKWVDYTNLVLKILAPIRDLAREGTKQ